MRDLYLPYEIASIFQEIGQRKIHIHVRFHNVILQHLRWSTHVF